MTEMDLDDSPSASLTMSVEENPPSEETCDRAINNELRQATPNRVSRKRRRPVTKKPASSIHTCVPFVTQSPLRFDRLNLRTPSPRRRRRRGVFKSSTPPVSRMTTTQLATGATKRVFLRRSSQISPSPSLSPQSHGTPTWRQTTTTEGNPQVNRSTTDFVTPRPRKRIRLDTSRGCLSTGQKKVRDRRVQFASVSVHSFQQRSGMNSSSVPEEGTALHLGDHVDTSNQDLEDFEAERLEQRKEVFDILSPVQRKKLVKDQSPDDISRGSLRKEQEELEQIRESRSAVGCKCLPPSKMTKRAIMETFDLLDHEYDKKDKKNVLMKQLQSLRGGNFCCVDRACLCFSNGIDCHYHQVAPVGCSCARHLVNGKDSCSNEFGLYRPEIVPFHSPAVRKILNNWNSFYDPEASPTQYSRRRKCTTKRSLAFADDDSDFDPEDEDDYDPEDD